MKIKEVKDELKRILIEFTYAEWFEYIYLTERERERREFYYLPLDNKETKDE